MNLADTPTATPPSHHTQEHILSHYRSQLEAIEADYADLLRERFLLTGLPPNTNIIDAPPISIPSMQQVDSAVSELMKGAISTPKSPRTHPSFLRPERRHQTRPPDNLLATWAASNDEEQNVVISKYRVFPFNVLFQYTLLRPVYYTAFVNTLLILSDSIFIRLNHKFMYGILGEDSKFSRS